MAENVDVFVIDSADLTLALGDLDLDLDPPECNLCLVLSSMSLIRLPLSSDPLIAVFISWKLKIKIIQIQKLISFSSFKIH